MKNDAYRLVDEILGPSDDNTMLLEGSAESVPWNFGPPEPDDDDPTTTRQ